MVEKLEWHPKLNVLWVFKWKPRVWVVGFGLVDSLALVPFNLHRNAEFQSISYSINSKYWILPLALEEIRLFSSFYSAFSKPLSRLAVISQHPDIFSYEISKKPVVPNDLLKDIKEKIYEFSEEAIEISQSAKKPSKMMKQPKQKLQNRRKTDEKSLAYA